MSNIKWQARTTLSIAALGPPVASLIVLAAMYLPACEWRSDPVGAASFATPLILFAVAVGYAFGTVPALLTGAAYSGALTILPLLQRTRLLRMSVGYACGGLITEIWFRVVIGTGAQGYGLVAAIVAASLLASRAGRPSCAATLSDNRAGRPSCAGTLGDNRAGRPSCAGTLGDNRADRPSCAATLDGSQRRIDFSF
jgi:hypothetical protein